jgi:hypothetical protein
LLFSDWLYTYHSNGVVRSDEPSDVFAMFESWLNRKERDGEIDAQEASKRRADIRSRMKVDFLTLRELRGNAFIEQVPGGSRIYMLQNTGYQTRAENRYLMFAGILLAFASLFGFIVEMRLRQLKR